MKDGKPATIKYSCEGVKFLWENEVNAYGKSDV